MDYYEQFGLSRMSDDGMRTVYGEMGQWLMIVFHLFSGVDAVLYNQFARFERARENFSSMTRGIIAFLITRWGW